MSESAYKLVQTITLVFCMITLPSMLMAQSNPNFAFLKENANNPGVQVTKSGLQYKVLRKGQGKRPNKKSYVEVHYKGQLVNGTEFDNSYDRGQPSSFELTKVIPGWREGLQLMKEGAKFQFVVPSYLGYGVLGWWRRKNTSWSNPYF